jgi:hypothetical protein
MAELIKDKPPDEKKRFLTELQRVADEFEKIYAKYSDECSRTREQFPCTMTHFVFPSLLQLFKQIDEVKKMVE